MFEELMNPKHCPYCHGQKPLTDKVYDDGTKFDDSRGNSIGFMGSIPILKTYIREKYFEIFHWIPEDAREILKEQWCVEINYCPICGRPLFENKELGMSLGAEMIHLNRGTIQCIGMILLLLGIVHLEIRGL